MAPNAKNMICCVCGKRRLTHPEVKLHLFPKDARRRLQWLESLNIALLKNNRAVCDDHFDPIHFGCKGRLLSSAVPHPANGSEGQTTPRYHAGFSPQEESIDVAQVDPDSLSSQMHLTHYDCTDTNFGVITEDLQDDYQPQYPELLLDISSRDVTKELPQPNEQSVVPGLPVSVESSDDNEDCDLPEATRDMPETPCDLPEAPRDVPKATSDLPKTSDLTKAPSGLPEAPCGLPASPVHHQAAPPSKLQKNRTQVKLLQKTIYRLKRRIEQMKLHNIKTPKELLTKASHYLDPRVLGFFKWQILHAVENESARRYGIEERSFALAIYYQSPKTYKFLSSVFHLPPVQVLHSYLRTMSVNVGWSKHAITVLKNRAHASPKEDTLCGIVFGTMSIKECLHFDKVTNSIIGREDFGENGGSLKQANRALVFMVKGLVENWKLVLGCFFHAGGISTSKLKELYEASVRKVQSTGHRVIFTVCDQKEEVHHSLFQTLGMTREDPSFERKGEKIHFFYDSPYLLKCLTNTLLKYDMESRGDKISWNYIKQFIERDQEQKIRLAPKLTSKHVCGDGSSEIQVSTAAQVMSQTVAAGIYTHCVSGMLPQEAFHTAEFVQQVGRLYLHLNNSHALHLTEVVGGVTSESSHKQLVNEVTTYFTSLKVCVPPDVQTHCVDGWLINLASLQAVCQELSTYKVKCLLTSQLSNDCLENLFAKLRDKYEECGLLTAYNFLTGLKSIITNDLVEVPESGNCEAEDAYFLDISSNWESEFPFLPSDFDSESEESDEDYDDILL